MASAGQYNLSKKNICDITPQLTMASDNQRWPAMVSDCQFICRKRISAIYYSSPGAAALAMYLKYYIMIVNDCQGNLKSLTRQTVLYITYLLGRAQPVIPPNLYSAIMNIIVARCTTGPRRATNNASRSHEIGEMHHWASPSCEGLTS